MVVGQFGCESQILARQLQRELCIVEDALERNVGNNRQRT